MSRQRRIAVGFVVMAMCMSLSCVLSRGHSSRPSNTSNSGLNRVVSFAEKHEGPIDWRELQRQPEFRIVIDNLDAAIDLKELPESLILSRMVWRAAFLFGTDDQVARAFERCWAATPGGDIVAEDLASKPAGELWTYLRRPGRVSDEAIQRFCYGTLCNISFRRDEYALFHVTLQQMANNPRRPIGTRAACAYVLAIWFPDDAVGREGERIVRAAAEVDAGAAAALSLMKRERDIRAKERVAE